MKYTLAHTVMVGYFSVAVFASGLNKFYVFKIVILGKLFYEHLKFKSIF